MAVLGFLVLTIAGCGANDGILKSGKETPQANAETKTPFAKDLEAMQTADFQFVFVLRRKDGGVLDAEDRGVIRLHTTLANRRVAADDDKAFIIGSNNAIPPPNMLALLQRFAIENYSKPQPANTNANANSNK